MDQVVVVTRPRNQKMKKAKMDRNWAWRPVVDVPEAFEQVRHGPAVSTNDVKQSEGHGAKAHERCAESVVLVVVVQHRQSTVEAALAQGLGGVQVGKGHAAQPQLDMFLLSLSSL
jgi:hypothetical protein